MKKVSDYFVLFLTIVFLTEECTVTVNSEELVVTTVTIVRLYITHKTALYFNAC